MGVEIDCFCDLVQSCWHSSLLLGAPVSFWYAPFLQSHEGGDLAVAVAEDDFQCASGTGAIVQVVQNISAHLVFQRLDPQDYWESGSPHLQGHLEGLTCTCSCCPFSHWDTKSKWWCCLASAENDAWSLLQRCLLTPGVWGEWTGWHSSGRLCSLGPSLPWQCLWNFSKSWYEEKGHHLPTCIQAAVYLARVCAGLGAFHQSRLSWWVKFQRWGTRDLIQFFQLPSAALLYFP